MANTTIKRRGLDGIKNLVLFFFFFFFFLFYIFFFYFLLLFSTLTKMTTEAKVMATIAKVMAVTP